ncbi:MAG: exodeoxyribonuclease VII small subunit [Bacteroidetes bacterium]|jgi:exodeoxyribonuclease VII small subunit|uniref:Exodeoxyribonuclease 7 small subunit n=1 Tax=Rhodohalobacter sulfatireducens TaxID=2911366 RepID=A0ABS9K8N2_9BACT|nr:exodeoxyribonuclease VII small subunit [Rhodohalobacter sulfatireducens]MDR9364653.1 exodeoxyribonuclease VII small subunit [Balneolaceae bacterium]NBC02148.1 exodeoxyribonuclease VII small subunit [Bacteroidota bacterium]MCG2587163.1 exodeoxyribonuclease VII small subunit [Rhodohalobacter sulfatireducens]MDR9407273.1 exodeoxyribonuclease VII small subunit [Balneolaceae bacterium]NBC65991.1 exodeoxyribonuclease VII small subunit [Bacteroidota bacterium]
MTEKERPSFEEALEKLETIVEKLNDGEITLEKSVELYEEGLRLSKICSETLENAALKIEQIDQSTNTDKEA